MAGEKNVGLVLLDFWVSPFGQRCRIALAEKGLPTSMLKRTSWPSRATTSSAPTRSISRFPSSSMTVAPSLSLSSSSSTSTRFFPNTRPLLPADPYERAHARFWADCVDKKVYGSGSKMYTEPQMQTNIEMMEILKTLEGELGEKEFFGGEHGFGFVDVALIPFTAWFESFDKYWGVKVAEVAPKLVAWAA
ncbi:hypothetical protein ACQ4PT_059911 [Festuca glaucescens]